MHTPLIFRYPGHIPPATRSKVLVSNYDFLPTVLNVLDLKDKTPTEPPLPGRSYAAALAGKQCQWDNVVFFEFENTRAVRTPDWKYIERFPDGPNELYDLKTDPGERQNLLDQPAHAAMQQELRDRLHKFFDRYADPRFDLSRGGTSKAERQLPKRAG